MHDRNLICLFIEALNSAEIKYAVTGSVAGIVYGEPRLTHDVDIIVDLSESEVDALLDVFPEKQFYRPPREVVVIELRRQQRGHFNLIHHDSGFKADIYTVGDDDLQKWALTNRKRHAIGDDVVWVAPPEYVILRKLEYFREGGSDKHLRDISSVLEVSSELINFEFLKGKIKQLGLSDYWEKLVE